MVRLKSYLSAMDEKTKGWKEMYEGRVMVPPNTPGNATEFPVFYNDTTYWYNDISFSIELTNKLLLDRPTVLCMIPVNHQGIETYGTAVADDCYRQWKRCLGVFNDELYNRNKPPEETGWYYTVSLGGEILVRNTAYFEMRAPKDYSNAGGNSVIHFTPEKTGEASMCLCLRFQVQLPSRNQKKAIKLLADHLPHAVESFLKDFDRVRSQKVEELAQKQKSLREWLAKSEYCVFIANGSILPRDSGTGACKENAVPFQAPHDQEIEVCGIRGMGIKRGVTVITGGGYSGKSTILNAISSGIYDHILGDGRELCIADPLAVQISAEDGRCINSLDISPFISEIPGESTRNFSTQCASGSTSQAANILEAVSSGARLMLIDEDRSAANFMMKDVMMKKLIGKDPIIPYTERVNEIFRSLGISTILIIGGSGEYIPAADTVYLIDRFRIFDVTKQAKELYEQYGKNAEDSCGAPLTDDWGQSRVLTSEAFSPYPEFAKTEKLAVSDIGYIFIGREKIDTSHIYEIICHEQRTAVGFFIRLLENRNGESPFSQSAPKAIDLHNEIDLLYREIEEKGIDMIYSGFFPECGRFLALPRKMDLLAAIYRMRCTKYENDPVRGNK